MNATAGGLIGGALIVILLRVDQNVSTYVFFIVTLVGLISRKIPAPLIVIILGLLSYGSTIFNY